MSFEFFVARRYLFSKRKQAFIYVISLMSVLGVALGVAALVIVLGVYNGLTTDMREKILGANAHGMVLSTLPDGFAEDMIMKAPSPNIMNKLAELPDPEPQNTDFIQCVRNRERFALDEVKGYHSATLVNMALCALRLNRSLQFDPEKQLFVNDDAANRLIDQPMRAPWKI